MYLLDNGVSSWENVYPCPFVHLKLVSFILLIYESSLCIKILDRLPLNPHFKLHSEGQMGVILVNSHGKIFLGREHSTHLLFQSAQAAWTDTMN